MDAGHIERLLAAAYSQETCTLFKCFWPQLWNLKQRSAVPESAVLLAVGHDVLRDRLIDAGDIGKERGGGGVYVNADAVHAVLNDTGQGFVQLCLVHVMLILADSDRLRVDLDKLSQRILKPSGDGGSTSGCDVVVREFFCGQLAG